MKVISKPIDMVAWFNDEGILHPVIFKILGGYETISTIKVDKILNTSTEKLAGNPMIIFTCQSIINNKQRIYEIKYELNTCKWLLFKI